MSSTHPVNSPQNVQGLLTNLAPQPFGTFHSPQNPSQVNSESPNKSPIPIPLTGTPETIPLLPDYNNHFHRTARCATDIVNNLKSNLGTTLANSGPVSNIEEISSDSYNAQSSGTYLTSVPGQMHRELSDQGCNLDAFIDGFMNYPDQPRDVSIFNGPALVSNLTFNNSLLHSTASPIRGETSNLQPWTGSKWKADTVNLEVQEDVRGSSASH